MEKPARRRLRRRVYESIDDIERSIKDFTALHNEMEVKPFKMGG